MKINDIICGFAVKGAVNDNELGGTLWKMEHIKTGAQLVWLDNKEENKLFSVTLKTLPWDDTGVFHILEHSVLCGSENFPVKEPFLDLLKSSMNTFLNAMTFPDKTMYPVSSRNEQDFINLTRVYLDAVFCPAIYKNPCIFKQEGWHYELHEGDGMPTYKGVVFNEMKGAYSSVESVLDSEMCKILFPDNCYKYSSGGDPESIPSLTYEDFLAAHSEFYHPSNSRTYLDGDLPIERVLSLIDGYFDNYERSDKKHEINMQLPTKAKEVIAYYEVDGNEDEANKAHMSLGKLLCDWSDVKKILAADILSLYLSGSNAAPLKRAVLEDGLAQDIWLSVNYGIAQTYSVIRVRNTEKENGEAIKSKIKAVAQKLVTEGLDRDELEANINLLEFKLKEPEEPKGIERAIAAMNGWLYGGEPELYLMSEDVIAALRAELDTGYFEELVRELLLDEEYTSTLYVLPSKTKGEETRRRENSKLLAVSETWSELDREDIIKKTAELEEWQTSEDTPEAHATLPMLSLSDIDPVPTKIESKHESTDGVEFIYYPIASSGIVHANLYFNIADISFDKLSELSLAVSLFGELPTENYTLNELKRLVRKNIGSLGFGIRSYAISGDSSKCRLFFKVSMSVLEKNLEEAKLIVCEILKKTKFNSHSDIKEILLQKSENIYQNIIERGNIYASLRANRNNSAAAAVNEKLRGYDKYTELLSLLNSFDERIDGFSALAYSFVSDFITADRLTVSEVSTEEKREILDIVKELENKGRTDIPQYMTPELSYERVHEAIQIPSGVSYAALGANLKGKETELKSRLNVMSGILSFGYLWNEIRVLGGAYGCGFSSDISGDVCFRTFRDPTPLRSVDIFKNTAEFIESFVAGDEIIDKYIISNIASAEPLRSPEEKGEAEDARYFGEISYDERCRRRTEILNLSKQDLLSLCSLFETVAEEGSVCIVAHEGVISQLDDSWNIIKSRGTDE